MESLKPVKVAVVGCGMISNIYIKNLKHLFSITDVVALCNRTPEKAEQKAAQYGIPRTMRFEEVLEDPEIELVVNLTSPDAHYDIIRRALLAGKHVYTEKMLCPTFEQGKELVRIAREKGLRLGVAPDTFLGAGLQTARKVVDSGFIGEVTSALVSINRDHALASEIFTFLRGEGAGFPYDVGVYYITALLSLMGPVQKIAGFSTAIRPIHQGQFLYKGNYGKEWEMADRNVQVGSLLFESGAVGSIHFNGESVNTNFPLIMLFGREGYLSIGDPDGYAGAVTLTRKEEGSCQIPFTHGFKGSPVYGEPTPYDQAGGHRGLGVAEMCWSIRKERPHRCSMELGLHTMEVITGIDRSSETGKVYEMTTSFEKPKALPSGYLACEFDGSFRSDPEYSLTI